MDYRMSSTLIVVVPGLLAQPPDALAGALSLAAIAHAASRPRVEPRGLANALLAAIGAADETPVAPLAALGAGLDPGDDYVIAADPVWLAADRDDVVLLARIDDLSVDDAATLAALLDRHFAADGLRVALARPDAWFARAQHAPDLRTTPFDAACRHGMYAHLPRGADAGTWRRWQNEIQMLLHEHPINEAREANGRAAVTGIWFWGGGRLADAGTLPAVDVTAAPGRVGDIARGVGRAAGGATEFLDAQDNAERVVAQTARATAGGPARLALVVVDTIERAADIPALEARWLMPASRLLAGRRIERLELLADGNGIAAHWSAEPPTLWDRIAHRAGRTPFRVPAAKPS
jgi:hypothetical protein